MAAAGSPAAVATTAAPAQRMIVASRLFTVRRLQTPAALGIEQVPVCRVCGQAQRVAGTDPAGAGTAMRPIAPTSMKAPSPDGVAGSRFIAGAPMKPATQVEPGRR